MSDELLDELLSKPTGPQTPPREMGPTDLTRELEVSGNVAHATIADEKGSVNEGKARRFLEDEGLTESDWEVTHFRKIEYGNPEQPFESVKFSFKRRASSATSDIDLSELIASLDGYEVPEVRPTGDSGFLVLIGDMQFGKIDGDGIEGTVKRTMQGIHLAAARLMTYSKFLAIGHVHIAWLGDHIEGFVSQGGANSWRTQLPLNEQIRLTRRVMLEALKVFAPLAEKVTMAAVPGNHGEAVRFEGTGTTRYDDSHDTEALIAVSDTAEMLPEQFGHVRFYVPDTDELIVMTEVANTVLAHHHGHKWRPGKHWDWWADQAFNADSPMHMADVLLAGHLHHDEYAVQGGRTYWGQPALESESTYFRHQRGIPGAPGINTGIVRDGRVRIRDTIFL